MQWNRNFPPPDKEDDEQHDNNNDISSSISGYREAKERIAQLAADMDSRYGTRLRQGLRPQRKRANIPAKFKGMETADIEEFLNLMKHKPLTLSDYANLYSAIHNTGRSETEKYMKTTWYQRY